MVNQIKHWYGQKEMWWSRDAEKEKMNRLTGCSAREKTIAQTTFSNLNNIQDQQIL